MSCSRAEVALQHVQRLEKGVRCKESNDAVLCANMDWMDVIWTQGRNGDLCQ